MGLTHSLTSIKCSSYIMDKKIIEERDNFKRMLERVKMLKEMRKGVRERVGG